MVRPSEQGGMPSPGSAASGTGGVVSPELQPRSGAKKRGHENRNAFTSDRKPGIDSSV
jgi:hypothetical protein